MTKGSSYRRVKPPGCVHITNNLIHTKVIVLLLKNKEIEFLERNPMRASRRDDARGGVIISFGRRVSRHQNGNPQDQFQNPFSNK